MKVKFFQGPLDGAEIEAESETLPYTLIFPDHDSWDIFSEQMWDAFHQQQVFYELQCASEVLAHFVYCEQPVEAVIE